jgi:predicted lactoylglutathione lyase
MRNLLLIIFVSFAFQSKSQSKLGDVACVYVTTPNLDSSVAFYEKFGFDKIASNTFPLPWAQVSDGSLLIMMRKDPTPYIGLTYYVNDLDGTVAQLEKDGIVFAQKPKPGDAIKRYYIKSPDGFNIMLAPNIGGFAQPTGITMLNMKPADFASAGKYPNKICGVFGEFCHPVTDVDQSVAFWKKLGFTTRSITRQPYPYAIVSDGLMIIGLHQTKDFTYPAITYFGMNTTSRVKQLINKGLTKPSEMQGPGNVVFPTWEGQHLFIFSLGM